MVNNYPTRNNKSSLFKNLQNDIEYVNRQEEDPVVKNTDTLNKVFLTNDVLTSLSDELYIPSILQPSQIPEKPNLSDDQIAEQLQQKIETHEQNHRSFSQTQKQRFQKTQQEFQQQKSHMEISLENFKHEDSASFSSKKAQITSQSQQVSQKFENRQQKINEIKQILEGG